ncbi:MAG: AAA family ATPase [Firmicutes bacterium]|nr:AAA family ATPase [Bacillota bacterium]
MKYKPLAIGIDDFKEMIIKDSYYIDKTSMIRLLTDENSKVTLFTRPRRFGKTLNLSMIKYFFEDTRDEAVNEENRRLFDGLDIAAAGEDYMRYMQKYPVIFLSLKSTKQSSFDLSFKMLKDNISGEFKRYDEMVSGVLYNDDLNKYCKLRDRTANDSEYYTSIAFLSECLEKAYGKKAVILIDEYDVPLENAYYSGFYDKMISFVRSLFESALKTNPSLEFAVITGCLRISRESIFTGLNNLNIVSVIDNRYGEYFGFTPAEVENMMRYYGCESRMEDMRSWYDGYIFGKSEIYNPWSVIKFIYDLRADINSFPRPYWSNTSSNSIVRALIEKADTEVRGELEILLSGGTIEKPVYEDITYDDIYKNQDNLWNFLFFTGYLKKISERIEERTIYMSLAVPNQEVLYIYERHIKSWFDDHVKTRDMSGLYRALLEGDARALENEISRLLKGSISYMDSKEAFYHGFLAGVFVNMDNDYLVKSNRESGDGRFDLCVYNGIDTARPAAVIELKNVDNRKRMEQAAHEALCQISNRKYDEMLADEGYEECWHVGIGFFRKNCRIKIEKHKIEQ